MFSRVYYTQSGDSLASVAAHFGVPPERIDSSCLIPDRGFLDAGTPLVILDYLPQDPIGPAEHLIPDSEVVFSLTGIDFDVAEYVDSAGGRLASYYELDGRGGRTTGALTVEQVALDSSINPRLLLAYLQYYSGWVEGTPKPGTNELHLLGYLNSFSAGLTRQLSLLTQDLSAGYYGWRSGRLTVLTFADGTSMRLAPDLNAGTAALQYHFSRRLDYQDWLNVLDPDDGFMAFYEHMFGDPWERDPGPLIPGGLHQPEFALPFETGVLWSFTGGPHPAWEQELVYAALDFSPGTAVPGCGVSMAWDAAVAAGQIVRSRAGYAVLDLDGDGLEQTGWAVVYLHVASAGRVGAGSVVEVSDRIGHPSCEGGPATGTHLHIARKYNGEWIGAGGDVPFVMSGWTFQEGSHPYEGTMTKGDRTIKACKGAVTPASYITRQADE